MSHRVVFSPEAEEQLVALFQHIADAASPDIAASYTEAIVSHCESLRDFPYRGMKRDDVRPAQAYSAELDQLDATQKVKSGRLISTTSAG